MIIDVGLLIAGVLAAPPATAPLERFEQSQIHMGTSFKVVLYAPNRAAAENAWRKAFRRIEQLNTVMSDYDPDSELSRLSDTAPPDGAGEPGPKVDVSDDLWRVLTKAQTVSEQSNGAFDVTVGPLTKLWRRARRQKTMPPQDRLSAARNATGYQHLRLDTCGRTAQLARPQMRLDLGGIGKGFAVDEALRELRRCGLSRALVNGGGDMAIGDPPPGESGWKIGLAPLKPDSPPSRFVMLSNCGVATSGDAWQFVEINGVRYSHIVDPHTGLGLTHRSSVATLAPDGTTADALASAVSVLGPHKGLRFIEQQPRAAALIVVARDGVVQQHQSQRFERLGAAP